MGPGSGMMSSTQINLPEIGELELNYYFNLRPKL